MPSDRKPPFETPHILSDAPLGEERDQPHFHFDDFAVTLFARCQAFQKADLDAHLYRWNTLAKLRCVRKTIYILPRELLPVAFRATRALVEKESRRFLHQPVQILHQFLQFCRLQSLHVSFRICITG